jgi:hypothetical protein
LLLDLLLSQLLYQRRLRIGTRILTRQRSHRSLRAVRPSGTTLTHPIIEGRLLKVIKRDVSGGIFKKEKERVKRSKNEA